MSFLKKKSPTSRFALLVVMIGVLVMTRTAEAKQSSSKATKKIMSSAATCVIKGNINKKEKIYHLPGCASYKQTVIDVSAGERMFCTEADAKKAGWRKALNCPK